MKNFLKRENLIVLGIVAAMVVGMTVAVYMPQGRKLDQIQGQIATRQVQIEAESQKIAAVPDLIRQVQAMKVRYKDFDRKMPRSQELHEFLMQISGSLGQKDFSTAATTRQEHFSTLPIIMKFRGNFLTLAEFLNRVENLERLSCIQKLVVASAASKGDAASTKGKGDLDIELQLNIYFTES